MIHKADIMSKKNLHYMWPYYAKVDRRCVKCQICERNFLLNKNYTSVKRHIRGTHYTDDNIGTSNVKKKKSTWTFSIKDNRTKCNFCNKDYDICYTVSTCMRRHLKDIHKIDKTTAQEHRKWISCCNHILTLNSDNSTCSYCKKVFQNNNYYNLIKHLIDAHQINVPFEISSTIIRKTVVN